MRRKNNNQPLLVSVDASTGPMRQQGPTTTSATPLVEGVLLDQSQQDYLLPHFTAIIVGKPGSGKTSLISEMLSSKSFYNGKFKYILVISPSASKMGIAEQKNTLFKQDFSMQWIEERLFEINKKQVERIIRQLRDDGIIDKFKPVNHANDLAHVVDQFKIPVIQTQQRLEEEKSRLFSPSLFQGQGVQGQSFVKRPVVKSTGKKMADYVNKQQQVSLPQFVDEMYKKFLVKLSNEDRNKLYTNCLIVLDDVVSDIKSNENNPMLTQLFFNRRHLLLNGMVSVMLVSQKYTMIPARIRSSSNWLILFRLNPIDFENVYKDVVMMNSHEWESLVEFVYGTVSDTKDRKYNNLSIQVERDRYFLNFQPLNFNKEIAQ